MPNQLSLITFPADTAASTRRDELWEQFDPFPIFARLLCCSSDHQPQLIRMCGRQSAPRSCSAPTIRSPASVIIGRSTSTLPLETPVDTHGKPVFLASSSPTRPF